MIKNINIKVNARHIGQLGRELVTDYVTALTELVKNSYDADSEVVKVIFEGIESGEGRIIIADNGAGFSIDDIENKWAVIGTNSKVKSPYSDKYRRRCAGRKGIGRYSVERLAEYCTIYSFTEDGKGIKYYTNWNRYEGIDFSELKNRVEILKNHADFDSAKYIKRTVEYLLLSEKIDSESKEMIQREILNYNLLDYQMFYNHKILKKIEAYLYEICKRYMSLEERIEEIVNPIEEIVGVEKEEFYKKITALNKETKEIPTGTFIVLDNLRDKWKKEDIEKVTKEFRLLVSPLKEKNNFSIVIDAAEYELHEVKLENNLLKQRYAKVDASLKTFKNEEGKKTLFFEIIYEDIKGAYKTKREIFDNYICGDVQITLYYFLRDKSLKFENLKVSEAKEVLDSFCGIKIYRDGFRVRPYGEEGNDWLLLDRKKIKDPHSYRVGNNQIIGVVSINSDENPLLIDATNREAIIENEAFNQLKQIVSKCVNMIEEHRYKEYLREKENTIIVEQEEQRKKEKDNLNEAIEQQRKELMKDLQRGSYVDIKKQLEDIFSKVSADQKKEQFHYEKTKQEYEQRLKNSNHELQLYKNLAALGILAGSFGHETDDSIARMLLNIVYPKRRIFDAFPNDSDIKNAFDDLDKDIYRISCYSDLLVSFLKKKKRSESSMLSFKQIILELIRYYAVLLEDYRIHLNAENLNEFECKIPMKQIDVESIIINLLTNAFEALKGVKGKRQINISTYSEDGKYIIRVEDSGTGVPDDLREWIFMPLNTTKNEDGVGLGLTIVKDIVESYQGRIDVGRGEVLGGALFTIFFADMEELNG